MAKSNSKKKNKNKQRPKGTSAHVVTGTSSSSYNAGDTQPIWSTADEIAHYAELGCHITNIARCRPTSKSRSNHKVKCTPTASMSCSEYREMYETAMQQYPWLLGIERFDSSEYHREDIENIPEVAMNDGEDEDDPMVLTLTNVTKNTTNICFVTVYDVDVCDANGNILKSGIASTTTPAATNTATDNEKMDEKKNPSNSPTTTKERKCTTFIILCPPQTFVHLCSLAPNQSQQLVSTTEKIPITSWSQVEIESDVQPWSYHPNIEDEHPYLLHFPFCGTGKEISENNDTRNTTSYQCTQSEDGQLTHFFHGNYHAIDFACPIGTLLYSPVNGIVVDVHDSVDGEGKGESNKLEVSGIAASNLFHWNSVMIRVDDEAENVKSEGTSKAKDESTDPLYVEFVHIESNSCVVQVGDVVRKGQALCRSGSVGFSPEPHLHLAAYRSNSNGAATVRVRFEQVPSLVDKGENGSGRDTDDDVAANEDGMKEEKLTSFLPRTGGWYGQSGLVSN